MGSDIYSWAEKKQNGKWYKIKGKHFSTKEIDKKCNGMDSTDEPFYFRDYSVFGFLADFRNYSQCPPISEPRGFPTDSEFINKTKLVPDINDYTHFSYLTLRELLEFDYNKEFYDKRDYLPQPESKLTTYKNFLDDLFFTHLEELKKIGDPDNIRVVFYFDY